MSHATRGHVTEMLIAAAEGDSEAAADLLPLVYGELRRLAEAQMTAVPPGQTLQATALVHEAYVRLIGKGDPGWRSRGHFFFAAARAIHDILVEQARRKARLKRGGDRRRVSGTDLEVAVAAPSEDMLALSARLERLEQDDPRQHPASLVARVAFTRSPTSFTSVTSTTSRVPFGPAPTSIMSPSWTEMMPIGISVALGMNLFPPICLSPTVHPAQSKLEFPRSY